MAPASVTQSDLRLQDGLEVLIREQRLRNLPPWQAEAAS
jgi:hypothetical protein